jgi:hypothetical protein
MPTTAGSEFSSLKEELVFGEKHRSWREILRAALLASGKIETPELNRVNLPRIQKEKDLDRIEQPLHSLHTCFTGTDHR